MKVEFYCYLGDIMNKRILYKVLLLLVAFVWGMGFPVIKIILNSGLSPNAIVAIRFLAVFLVLYLYLKLMKIKITKHEILIGSISGLALGLGFTLQTVGLVYTTSSKNAFLTGAYVIWVPFFNWIVTKKNPQLNIYLSSILCFIGIGLISLNELQLSLNYGDFLTLLCAIFFSIQIVILGTKIKYGKPIVINTFQMLSAGILALILNIIFENFSIIKVEFTGIQVISLVYLILFNTFAAFMIQTSAQKILYPQTVTLILSTEMIFAALMSYIILDDPITPRILCGGILMFISVIISEINFKKKSG